MKQFFLGFDLGSHSSKGVIIGEDGIPVASTSLNHWTDTSKPGWQEQDPEIWWREFYTVTKVLLKKSNVIPSSIRAVGITGFVPGLVLLNQKGDILRPCIMHTDTRAKTQLKNVNKLLETEISHGNLIPKLIWVLENEKMIFDKIYKIVVPHGYIVGKLTGKFSCDRDTASIFGGIYDDFTGQWDSDNCRKLGVEKEKLPDLFNTDSVVGFIQSGAAELTGLEEGTPVIAGTGDTFSALLGCGAIFPGDTMIYLGSSGTQLYINGDLDDFIHGPHFGSGKAEFTGRIISCGETMQHYRDILGFTDWEKLDREALDINPGSDGLLIFPHLKQKNDTETTKGDLETVFGLESSHSPWHIYRAAMEGIAYNLKFSFANYESKVKKLILTGGGARSQVFREIIAAVLNKDLYYNPMGDGSIGIALLAAYTVTDISIRTLSALISENASVTEKDNYSTEIYSTQYRKYQKIRNIIEELYMEQEI